MRVILRSWGEEDAPALARVLSHKKIHDNLRDGLPFPYTEKDARDYILSILHSDPNHTFAYAVVAGGTVVGNIGVFRQGNIHCRTGELGYYLAEEFWGKGIMSQAVTILCEELFAKTDLLRIFAQPFTDNIGSRRVLEKTGFHLEGIMKNNGWKNGRVKDMAMYARTRDPITYRKLAMDEIPEALSLAWQVFSQFEAPVYSEEGTEEFRRCLQDESYLAGISYYGAFDGSKLVGQVGIRTENNHICFFFVRDDYQRKGIGTKLFEYLSADHPADLITLNSSPYGIPFYKSLGFVPTGKEQTVNGICFTPMKYNRQEE